MQHKTYGSKVGDRKVASRPSNLGGIATKIGHDGINAIGSIKSSRHGLVVVVVSQWLLLLVVRLAKLCGVKSSKFKLIFKHEI
jgi:hypothetical protein